MEQLSNKAVLWYRRSAGFTMVEMVLVVALIAILSALALPSYRQWRENLVYRETARDITSLLRKAKNDAISTNREHLVAIDPVLAQMTMRKGNLPINTNWGDLVNNPLSKDIIAVSPQVVLVPVPPALPAAPLNIQFEPNGTVNIAGAVQINDTKGATRLWVDAAQSGRIRVCSLWPCP